MKKGEDLDGKPGKVKSGISMDDFVGKLWLEEMEKLASPKNTFWCTPGYLEKALKVKFAEIEQAMGGERKVVNVEENWRR